MIGADCGRHSLNLYQKTPSEPLPAPNNPSSTTAHPVSFNKRTHASTLYKAVVANQRLEQLERRSIHNLAHTGSSDGTASNAISAAEAVTNSLALHQAAASLDYSFT